MQAAENWPSFDTADALDSAKSRRILAERQMRTGCIIVVHVGPQHVPQVPLAEHDDMVETFPSDRADQALRVPILPRRARCCRVVSNTESLNATNKRCAITGVAIADQSARRLLPACVYRKSKSERIDDEVHPVWRANL